MDSRLNNGSVTYGSLIAPAVAMTTTPTNGNHTVNCSGSLSSLTVTVSVAPGSAHFWTFDVMVNNSVVGLSCQISGSKRRHCADRRTATLAGARR